jgi:hypothetical protein
MSVGCAWSAEPAGPAIAQAIREAALDPEACFRVREMNFNKEDLRFYLTDGFLMFAKPVMGQRLFAVFSAEVEGGDAEVLLMPPHRSERRSLASFAGSPTLNEHFRTALLLFSDGTGEELLQAAGDSGKRSVEMGALMKDRWTSLAHNIAAGFEVRLVQDLLSPDRSLGFFFAAIAGNKLGNFDVVHDLAAREQIVTGQYTTRGTQPSFDVWTSFESKSVRSGRRKPAKPSFELSAFGIDATLDAALHMQAVTRAKLTLSAPSRAFGLNVSDKVRITAISIDGQAVEIYARESMRDEAMRGGGNTTFVAITPAPLDPGQPHEIEIQHEGDVVIPAGNQVYYVTSRGNWYPRNGGGFATYDLTFRYPKHLTLVATGDSVEERVEGDVRISRRRTSAPVRVAGFNLGVYANVKLARSGYSLEVFGNEKLEPYLQPKPAPMVFTPLSPRSRMPSHPDIIPATPPAPIQPASRLAAMAEDIAGAFDFMRAQFGPPPIRSLTVSPIPGLFGQGFPGLVYISTLAYLRPEERPAALRNKGDELFFSDLLAPHEVAHQWWGNSVAPAAYEDDWLMEAMASYASLLYLEKRRGSKSVESILESFQTHLLHKGEDGNTVETAGPITWGQRLHSHSENAWRVITYEKGAWIIHMLRRRMGDERFHRLLAETCRRYAHEPLSTEQFRKLAEETMGPKSGADSLAEFFESWVYGTGIPALKLTSTVKGKAPALRLSGTLAQSGVEDDFSVEVPVEVYQGRGTPLTFWVRTSNEPVSFSVSLKQPPTRVSLPAGTGVLAIRK